MMKNRRSEKHSCDESKVVRVCVCVCVCVLVCVRVRVRVREILYH